MTVSAPLIEPRNVQQGVMRRAASADAFDVEAPALTARERLLRNANTLRYYRAGQVLRRAQSLVRRRFTGGHAVDRFQPRNGESVTIEVTPGLTRMARRKLRQHSDAEDAANGAAIRNGEFTFLGTTRRLGTAIDWRADLTKEMSRLWRFQLAYQEWLLDLAAESESQGIEADSGVWDCVHSWIEAWDGATEHEAGDAWHPFCISRRLPVWLALWAWREPPADSRPAIARSLAAQASYLSRRLETDLGGNHLLENLRALSVAAAAMRVPESTRWLATVRRLLPRELAGQILASGEHFERSPMYHCHMLDAALDLRDVLGEAAPDLQAACVEAATKMSAFLAEICHPDGEIPLLGDAVLNDAPSPATLEVPVLRSADLTPSAKFCGSTWTCRRGNDFLLFDAGPVGPDDLPAHAHADLLTIEASIGGERFIVDTGVFDYEDGAARRYCRSTAAHNVLEIDGENQCDVWSRFRMGRRGWPSALQSGQDGDLLWSGATHNAYRHISVEVVGRWIGVTDECWLILDWALGHEVHTLVNRLHLHPDVEMAEHNERQLKLHVGGELLTVQGIGDGRLDVGEGWYCPKFGVRQAALVLEWESRTAMPAVVGWCISRSDCEAPRIALSSAKIEVNWPDGSALRNLRIDVRSGAVVAIADRVAGGLADRE